VLTVILVGYLIVGSALAGLMVPCMRKGVPSWAASGPDDPAGQQMDRDVERRFTWVRFELDVRDRRTILRFGLFLLVVLVAWPLVLLASWRVNRRYSRRWSESG
jgi:hypothetical protein